MRVRVSKKGSFCAALIEASKLTASNLLRVSWIPVSVDCMSKIRPFSFK